MRKIYLERTISTLKSSCAGKVNQTRVIPVLLRRPKILFVDLIVPPMRYYDIFTLLIIELIFLFRGPSLTPSSTLKTTAVRSNPSMYTESSWLQPRSISVISSRGTRPRTKLVSKLTTKLSRTFSLSSIPAMPLSMLQM